MAMDMAFERGNAQNLCRLCGTPTENPFPLICHNCVQSKMLPAFGILSQIERKARAFDLMVEHGLAVGTWDRKKWSASTLFNRRVGTHDYDSPLEAVEAALDPKNLEPTR